MPAFAADSEPPEEVFDRSPFEFRFAIPDSFGKPVNGKSAYLDTDAGKAPYRQLDWENGGDVIVVRWMVVPDASWRSKTPEKMLTDAKTLILRGNNVKLISERDYKIGECPARSFILSTTGDRPNFQRIDYILAKPDLNVVMYASPKKEALDGSACSELFKSIAIEPKKPKK